MKKTIFFLFLIVTAGSIFSQTLNLEEARLLALASSRSLAKYELNIRTSVLDERNQFYSMLPSVSAGYSASMTYLKDWELVNPFDNLSAGADLSITQIIFQGGKSFINRALSSISTESARNSALAEYFSVLDSVDSAYYAVLEAEATLESEASSLESAKLNLEIAEIRLANGMVNQGEYLRALADKESRENSYNQARRSLSLSMTRFKNLTGITGSVQLEQIDFSAYEGALNYLSVISDEDADVLYEDIWKILASSNPSLSSSAIANQRAEMNLSLAWRDFYPTISATVLAAGLNYSSERGFSTPGSGSITIRGSIPIDFWVVSNRIERNRIARDSAAIDYTNAVTSMELELQSALYSLFAQAGSVLSTRRTLEYTERSYNIVMERNRLSQSSISEISEVSTQLINSRNSHIKASYSFLQNLSKFRSLCALDDEDQLLRILLGN